MSCAARGADRSSVFGDTGDPGGVSVSSSSSDGSGENGSSGERSPARTAAAKSASLYVAQNASSAPDISVACLFSSTTESSLEGPTLCARPELDEDVDGASGCTETDAWIGGSDACSVGADASLFVAAGGPR